jgi:phage shock protein A
MKGAKMENLNAEQIKKALECCSKDDCDNCPNDFGNCYSNLAGYALALINSQEQRIGAQDMTISELRQRAEKAEHDARRYEQRIKELTEGNEKLTINMNAYGLTAKRLGEENEDLLKRNANLHELARNFARAGESLTEENERVKGRNEHLAECLDIEDKYKDRLRGILFQFTDIVHKWGNKNGYDTSEISLVPVVHKANTIKLQIVADAVRQMQERIKERCIKGGIYPAFVKSTIDQIAEEIIGDAKQ